MRKKGKYCVRIQSFGEQKWRYFDGLLLATDWIANHMKKAGKWADVIPTFYDIYAPTGEKLSHFSTKGD